MDIRAFGSVYGQTPILPYASGFVWVPSDGQKTFPTCRSLFVESKSTPGTDDVYVRLNDMGENQFIHIENVDGNIELPFGAVTLSGGSVNGVVVLY
ncbi:MAG: hypothetical protein CBD94_01815 [Gammaproteobacteria bacterium TMED234]|jgi:hypothetical protein|nr:MAG: hypothetical protein CBD94_01815 [Gammaproteobacteria bacterium TMED234]